MASNLPAYRSVSSGDSVGTIGLAGPLMAFTTAALAAFVAEIPRYARPGESIGRAASTVLCIFYSGLLMCFLVQLRLLGGPASGMAALVALLVVVKFGDIGAYTVGRLVGKHKMAPVISPGKTIEGALGGLVFACVGAWLVFRFLRPALAPSSTPLGPWSWLLFGVVVGAAGMLGDLIESLLKRDMRAKDSSKWMPGFGGILDMIDSLLVAAPVAYVCWWWLAT
jgi:phosphatidate cytidylyltransferase